MCLSEPPASAGGFLDLRSEISNLKSEIWNLKSQISLRHPLTQVVLTDLPPAQVVLTRFHRRRSGSDKIPPTTQWF